MLIKRIICFIICALFVQFAYCQMKTKDIYKFTIRSGTEEWKQFETIDERVATLQIPDDVLKKISTEGLLETCLEFPYLLEILHGSNAQHGFEGLMEIFNGYRELFRRSDLTNALMEKYKNFKEDVKSVRLLNDVEQGMFSFRHFVLEFMLTQDVVLKNLSVEQEKQLFLLSFDHKKIKQNYSDFFGPLNNLPTNLLYAKKVMSDSNFKFGNAEIKKALSDFIQAPIVIDQQTMDFVEDYINVKFK